MFNATMMIDGKKYIPLTESGKWLMVRLVNDEEIYDEDVPLFSIITNWTECNYGEYTEKEDFGYLNDAVVALSWKPVMDR